ncbi:MAG: Gx transporter family protein [Oscillospiraceae bacterium]|nr:Gx transporter family protein [Oscillospiraceae bacterium]
MKKHVARYALLAALAMVLSWLESLLVFPGLLPGMKVGLTNIVVLFALYRMGLRDAVRISLVRVILVSITFGNAYSFAYSLAGAALSLAVMAGLKKWDAFSILGVSVAGGVCHNLGQLAVAMAVLETARLGWYLPVLLASGTAAGVVIGIAGGLAAERVKF